MQDGLPAGQTRTCDCIDPYSIHMGQNIPEVQERGIWKGEEWNSCWVNRRRQVLRQRREERSQHVHCVAKTDGTKHTSPRRTQKYRQKHSKNHLSANVAIGQQLSSWVTQKTTSKNSRFIFSSEASDVPTLMSASSLVPPPAKPYILHFAWITSFAVFFLSLGATAEKAEAACVSSAPYSGTVDGERQ